MISSTDDRHGHGTTADHATTLPPTGAPVYPILDPVDRLEMFRREADEYRLVRQFRRRRRSERARDPAR